MRGLTMSVLVGAILLTLAAGRVRSADLPELTFTDQFEKPHSPREHAGEVLVLVYGDRKGTAACRQVGEWLHVHFHPTAATLPAKEGQNAPVRAMPGVVNPIEVRVVPVACTGKLPKPLRPVVRQQFRQGSPDVAVWLDYDDQLRQQVGLADGQPNLVVVDSRGQLRHTHRGAVAEEDLRQLAVLIEQLREEAGRE